MCSHKQTPSVAHEVSCEQHKTYMYSENSVHTAYNSAYAHMTYTYGDSIYACSHSNTELCIENIQQLCITGLCCQANQKWVSFKGHSSCTGECLENKSE